MGALSWLMNLGFAGGGDFGLGAYIDGMMILRSGSIPTMALASSGSVDGTIERSGGIDATRVLRSGDADTEIERSGDADMTIEPL